MKNLPLAGAKAEESAFMEKILSPYRFCTEFWQKKIFQKIFNSAHVSDNFLSFGEKFFFDLCDLDPDPKVTAEDIYQDKSFLHK